MKRKKNEKYRESQKLQIHLVLPHKKLYFARKHSLKKSSLYHHILFRVFMRCRIFETQYWYTKAHMDLH